MVISKCIDERLKSLGRTVQELRSSFIYFRPWQKKTARIWSFQQSSKKSPTSHRHGKFQTVDWNFSGTTAETLLTMTTSVTQLQPSRWSSTSFLGLFLFPSTEVTSPKIWRLCDSLKRRYSKNANWLPLKRARSPVIFLHNVSIVHKENVAPKFKEK